MGSNNSDDLFSNPENLRIPEEQLRRSMPTVDKVKVKVIHPPVRRRQLELQFFMFPKEVLQFVTTTGRNAASVLAVLNALYETHFRNFKCNPVRFTSCSLKQRGLSHDRKTRALKLLAKSGHITMQQNPGKNPLVTLNWLRLKKPTE